MVSSLRAHSLDQLYEAFTSLDRQCSTEVDNAIRRWCCNGMLAWPELSPNSAMMLRLRLESAEQLLHLLLLRQAEVLHGHPVAPQASLPVLARRILINWWKDRGRETGADLWVARQWDFVQNISPAVQLPALPKARAFEPSAQVAYA